MSGIAVTMNLLRKMRFVGARNIVPCPLLPDLHSRSRRLLATRLDILIS
jgi:hypothetical protein